MKHLLLVLSLISGLALSMSAQAREVTFTTQLARYNGSGAYLAIYLTDANGRYKKTIWVAGTKTKYLRELPGWSRGSRMKTSEYDGVTSASVTSGRTLVVKQNIDDTLIDKGYRIVVDTAVEDARSNRADVSIPFTTSGSGNAVTGSMYVLSFTYKLK